MISTNILKSLESNFQDPSYSVIISKFEQPEFCNKDQLKIYMQQFSPNLEHIIDNNLEIIDSLKSLLKTNNIPIPNDIYPLTINNCIQKTLIIDSSLDYNINDSMYISKLIGSLENDLELDIHSKLVKGTICSENKRVILTQNDVPNYFNRSRFKIKDNILTINVPKKIKTINIKIEKCATKKCYNSNNQIIQNCQGDPQIFTETNIINNEIKIPLNLKEFSYTFSLSYTLKESLTLQTIESITTPLKSTINLNFNYVYNDLPAIIVTIDEDKKNYSSYNTTFTTDKNNNYNGVSIHFVGLKRQKEYGDVNITIIGVEKKDGDNNASNN